MMSKDYVPLYPLLEKYWDKPLAKVPAVLRDRVCRLFWNTTWDKADIEIRQDAIRCHDVLCDDTQEMNTWHQLFLYAKNTSEDGLDDGILHCIIEEAKNNGNAAAACILKDHVAIPLAELLDGNIFPFPHWPNTEPLLWRKLYEFSKTLSTMRDTAKKNKDYAVVLALDDVSAQLELILDIDRDRIGDQVVAAYEAENTQQAAPVEQAAPDAVMGTSSKDCNVPTTGKGKAGRPKSIEKKVIAVRQMMERLEKAASTQFNPQALRGSAADLLAACQRFEKSNNIEPMLFSTSQDTFNNWLRRAGYSFPTGRTLDYEKNYWTQLVVKATV